MKKLITTIAMLSCAVSVQARTCDSFAITPCASQVVTIATNSLNKAQYASSICISKNECGQKMATVSLVPTCAPCAMPSCDPCAVETCLPCGGYTS